MKPQPNFGHHAVNGSDYFLDAWGDGPMLIRWRGKEWRFEFSEMFGPSLLTKDGEISARQPTREDHPFWLPFQRWMNSGRRCRAVRSRSGRLRFWLCHVPRHEELA